LSKFWRSVFANLCAPGERDKVSGFWRVTEISVKLKQKQMKNFGEREKGRDPRDPGSRVLEGEREVGMGDGGGVEKI